MNPSTAAHLYKVHGAIATERGVRAPTEASDIKILKSLNAHTPSEFRVFRAQG